MRFLGLVLLVPCVTHAHLQESFSGKLNQQRWIVSNWTAPRDGPTNHSTFSPKHVFVQDGALVLKLTQKKNADGSITSIGGEIKTVAKLGYGTYEFELKASSSSLSARIAGEAVSGSITGTGPFLDFSETEIDVEFEGLSSRAALVQTSTWTHEDHPSETNQVALKGLPHQSFHRYKFIWIPGVVTFYRDGKLVATHKKVVPTRPAQFIFNHWGTNDEAWGGIATPGVDRYMYVRNFSYIPLPI